MRSRYNSECSNGMSLSLKEALAILRAGFARNIDRTGRLDVVGYPLRYQDIDWESDFKA